MEIRITTRPRAFAIFGRVDDDSNQCLQTGEREFDYEVIVYGDSVHLNEHGFILDRNAIPEYFKVTYSRGIRVLPSCEVMAANAAAEVGRLCEGRAHKVEATVGGATATWSKARKVGDANA